MEKLSLELLLENEEKWPDLTEVLQCFDFYSCLNKANPNLLAFIVKNFDRILSMVFEEKIKDSKTMTAVVSILCSSNPTVKNVLFKETKFVNYIIEYPKTIKIYHPPSIPQYFHSLPSIISDNSNEISSQFANKDYIESIIQICDLIEAFTFMKNLLNSRSPYVMVFLSQINIAQMLTNIITDNNVLSLHGILLFESIIDRYARQCAAAIVNNNMITRMINLSIQKDANNMANFTNFLYQESYRYPNESIWQTIQFLVDDRIPEICESILSRPRFMPISRSLCEIVLTYLEFQGQFFPKAVHVTEKLINDMFTHPTNSFLHNTSLKFIDFLSNYPVQFTEICSRTELCKKIIEYDRNNQKQANSCVWGVLWQISLLIRNPIGVPKKEWDLVIARNKKMHSVISTPLPKAVMNKYSKVVSKLGPSSLSPKFSLINIFAVVIGLIAGILVYANNK